MKDTLSKVLIFAAGAAIGSVVTWRFLDAKYTLRAEREIEDVINYYEGKREPEPKEAVEDVKTETNEVDATIKEYSEITKKYKSTEGGSEDMSAVPYVIHPDEYDELEDYDTMSLTHYDDGVLADEDDNVIEDVDNMVGADYASHFGEYEDDSVYIRNDRLKIDIEILKDYRPFSDVVDITSNRKGRG